MREVSDNVKADWGPLKANLATMFERPNWSACDAMIVVPPGARLDFPAIGPHLLAACALDAGFRVRILYANMIYAAVAGVAQHRLLCSGSEDLLGERVFAAPAYGVPLLGNASCKTSSTGHIRPQYIPPPRDQLHNLAIIANHWVNYVSEALAQSGPSVIGCSTMFLQTAASVALLRRIKILRPDRIAIIGGPNCEGEMAEGVLTLCDQIDYAFSGESEETFPAFLLSVRRGCPPARGVIKGTPLVDMDKLPAPNYSDYYEQLDLFLPDSEVQRSGEVSMPYETSRGCWWGQKQHCTFCGLNGYGMNFRAKSPRRVFDDLKSMIERHPNRRVQMVDNIMPHTYFRTFLPQLPDEVPDLKIFYEQKSNLTLDQIIALRRAGVTVIQPGIESLSTPLLKRMRKGVSARKNIAMLRYSRSVGLTLMWNILYGFPGDLAEEYEPMLSFLPKLQHLNPPSDAYSVCIDRFSPYFSKPEEFGLTNLRPSPAYETFLPSFADVSKVAYQFTADFASESLESAELEGRLLAAIAAWGKPWVEGLLPVLELTEMDADTFMLLDTRQLSGGNKISFLSRTQAAIALTGFANPQSPDVAMAIERGWVIELDGWLVPLATAEPELLSSFEAEFNHARASTSQRIPIVQPIPSALC